MGVAATTAHRRSHPRGIPVLTTAYARTPSRYGRRHHAERRGQVRMCRSPDPAQSPSRQGPCRSPVSFTHVRLRHTPEHAFSPDPNQNIPGPLDG